MSGVFERRSGDNESYSHETNAIVTKMQMRRLRNECVALAMVVAFILYGSLYPFTFITPSSNIGPFEALLATWDAAPQRGDVLANLIFYMPLGFVATRALLL